MKRTTIMLPSGLKREAELQARRRRISLASYIRRSLEQSIRDDRNGRVDPLFDEANLIVVEGGPTDMARNLD